MTSRFFVGLVLITIVTVITAGISLLLQEKENTVSHSSSPMFPKLIDQVNNVAQVSIRTAESVTTLKKDGNNWTVYERFNYPADFKKVRTLILSMARLEKLQAKTHLPSRYGRLHLRDISQKGSQAKHITLLDNVGEKLADLLVGKYNNDIIADGFDSIYVRLPGDEQSWLVRGGMVPSESVSDWLDRRIIDLPYDRIRKLTLRYSNAIRMIIERSDTAKEKFTILNAPKGSRPRNNHDINNLMQTLTGLTFEDVKPVHHVSFLPEKTLVAEFYTIDGPSIKLLLTRHEKQDWVRLLANINNATDKDSILENKDSAISKQIRRIVDKAAARTDGWVFRLPPHITTRLRKKREDLLALPEKKEEFKEKTKK